MGISSINQAMGASYGAYSQKLTQATRNKLEMLGIIVPENITEQEGKRILREHETTKKEKANQEMLFQGNQNSNPLLERAKKLANKLGISTTDNMTFTQIIALIESVLKEKIEANQNNIEALKELKGLSQELASIQAESSGSLGLNNSNQTLMQSLEMLSEYNKNFLHK